jgi:hypothetical protein
MSIQRLVVIGDGWETEHQCDDGDYVKYTDHVKHIEALQEAVVEAHRIILHEMDNGRTPTMLKAEHGGKGFGYFEDLIK